MIIPRKPPGFIRVPRNMQRGLVGYWAFNEKDGNLIRDHSNTMANGVFSGVNQRWMPQHFGPSLYFDGDADLVDLGIIPVDHPLQLTGYNYTIMIWCKAVGIGDAYQRIIDKSDSGSGRNGYALTLSSNNNGHEFYVDGSRILFTSGTRTGDWQQIAVRSSSTAAEMLINLVRVDFKLPDPIPNSAENMRFGSWNHSDGREFRGNIGLVIIYNRTLSDDEMRFLYNHPFGFVRKPRPIGAFPEFVPSPSRLFLGSTQLNNAYVGGTQLQKVMLGSTQLLP